jgi:hypothetical protein
MRSLLISAAAVLAMAPAAASATVLTFDIAGGISNFENMPPAYGDNVAATLQGGHSYGVGAEGFTPNVVVSYGIPGPLIIEDPALWTTGYGDLTNIYFQDSDGDTTFTTRFTADAGYLVNLLSFDMASFLTAGQTIQGFTIRDVGANTVLFTQGSTFITGATHNAFNFTGVSANSLELVVNLTGLGSRSDDIGLDNIRFSQSLVPPGGVPEPSVWALMIGGFFGAGAMLRSRRKVLA